MKGSILKTVSSNGNETRISTQFIQEDLLLVNVGEKSVKVLR